MIDEPRLLEVVRTRRRGLAGAACSRPSSPARSAPAEAQPGDRRGEQPAVRRDLRRAAAATCPRRSARARVVADRPRAWPRPSRRRSRLGASRCHRSPARRSPPASPAPPHAWPRRSRSRSGRRGRRRAGRDRRRRPGRPRLGAGARRARGHRRRSIHADAGWARAVADHAAAADRPIRLVTLTDATTAGGRSRAQAAAQLRSGRAWAPPTTASSAFAVSVERCRRPGARRRARRPPGVQPRGPGALRRRAGGRSRLARAPQPPASRRQHHLRRSRRSRAGSMTRCGASVGEEAR